MATMLYDATLYLAEALCIFGFLHSLPHRSLPVWLRVSVVVLRYCSPCVAGPMALS